MGALTLVLGACSSDDGASAPTTTAAPSTSRASGGSGAEPTPAELAAILPVAIDLGEGWVEQPAPEAGTDDRSTVDPVVAAQCPALEALLDGDDEKGDDGGDPVIRAFTDDWGRLIGFELDPAAPARSDAELEEAVDATNACGPIVVDDVPVSDTDRATTTYRFQAAIDPDHGEQAVKLQAEVSTLLASEDEPALATLYLLVFRTGSVGVTISALDGLDLESLEITRTDMDLLTGLSDRLEASVDDLVG